jgi:hypothetical protein
LFVFFPKTKTNPPPDCDQISTQNGFEEEDSDEDEKRSNQGYVFSGFETKDEEDSVGLVDSDSNEDEDEKRSYLEMPTSSI